MALLNKEDETGPDGGPAADGRLLVVNAGSSTLKLAVLDGSDRLLAGETLETPGGRVDDGALHALIDPHGPYAAAGHRVVHGGTELTTPVLVDDGVVERIRQLTPLAPLHQPGAVAGLEAVGRALPGVPAVACFDTAFHSTIGPGASTYAVPLEWRRRWHLRRYGFHGLNHSYVSRRVGQLMAGRADDRKLRVVTCHLGAGASLAAVSAGRCVDTTMGFTPLEGLVMATRSGSVDPGLVLWLAHTAGLSVAEISEGLERNGGLLGLAGTADMREVIAREAAGDERAALAMQVYLHSLRSLVAAMAASLGGLDALAFTGGIGEHSAEVRRRAVDGLGFLGVQLDPEANEAAGEEAEITPPGPSAACFVVAAREDLEIDRGVREVLLHR